jgi:hypothetical protein
MSTKSDIHLIGEDVYTSVCRQEDAAWNSKQRAESRVKEREVFAIQCVLFIVGSLLFSKEKDIYIYIAENMPSSCITRVSILVPSKVVMMRRMASSAIIVVCLMTSSTTLAWTTPITRVSTLSCTRRFSRTTTTTQQQQQHVGLRMSESSNDDNGPTFDEREQPSDPLQTTNNNNNSVSFDDAGRELVQQEDLARLEESGDFDTNPAVRWFVRCIVVFYIHLLLLLLLLYSHIHIIHVYVYSTRVAILKK